MTVKFKRFVAHSSPDRVVSFTDFIADTGVAIAGQTDHMWATAHGDTGNDMQVINATNGVIRLQKSATGADQSKAGMIQGLYWKANQGKGGMTTNKPYPVRLATRLRYTDTGAKGISCWFGFTDSRAVETPIIDTGGAVVSVATDAVGFGLSTQAGGGDTGWVGYAVNADVDHDPVVLDTGPNEGIYQVFEVELWHGNSDTGGSATFYIDGKAVGQIRGAVTPTVAMTPAFYVWGDTGGKQALDIDYVEVSGPRDTGL